MVADLSIRWRDPVMWRRAVDSCRADRDISVFGLPRLVEAFKRLPFKSIAAL